MSRPFSRKRLEMGEEKWNEYQKRRQLQKQKRWVERHPEKHIENVKKKNSYATYFRIRMKQELIAYKGGKCIVCGYEKNCPSAYDFHHRNPEEKEFAISKYGVLNRGKLKTEVDKCDLLCCRCHAELHDEENKKRRDEAISVHKLYLLKQNTERECDFCHTKFIPQKRRQRYCNNDCFLMSGKKFREFRQEMLKKCCLCQKEFLTKDNAQKYCCQECSAKSKRKVERPSKEQLITLLKANPMIKIGEMYGVSNNAVKKWMK